MNATDTKSVLAWTAGVIHEPAGGCMSRQITWLHLSDFHFCSPTSGWESDRILKKLKEDLTQLRDTEGLRPDFVVVTGDIAFGHIKDKSGYALADQYEEAAIFFTEILGIYDPPIPLENLFIVPGNHDVHRAEILEQTTLWLDTLHTSGDVGRITKMIRDSDSEWKAVMRRLDAYRDFLGKLGATHLLQDPERLIYAHVRTIEGLRVGIAGLNSAWSCGRAQEKAQLWLAGRWQLNTLEEKLSDADLRLALLHHPPNWFGEREDPSIGRQIEGVVEICLHGHEHEGWIGRQEHHLRIAAGAAYGSSDVESGYNMVRLDLDVGALQVWLRRYSNQGSGGWIPHVIPGNTDQLGRKVIDDLPWLARLRKKSDPPPPPPPPPPPAPAAPLSDGPEVRGIYGRAKLLAELSALMEKKPIVAVYGMPGIGKTTVVVELARSLGIHESGFLRFAVNARWTMADLFGQMARLLGNREEQPEPPATQNGVRDWSVLERDQRSALVLVEQAHLLFDEDGFRERDTAEFLRAVAEHAPGVRIVLECRMKPPESLLGPGGDRWLGSRMIQGLDKQTLAQLFRRPYINRPELGWVLADEEIHRVLDRLGGEKHKGAHPLAAMLLASVADGLGETPLEVLDRHANVLLERLEEELFRDLFDRVLSPGERKVLGLCAVYRDEIPGVIHPAVLNESAGDERAFQGLEQRCLLAHAQGQYYLHGVVRDLTVARRHDEAISAHAIVGGAWLQTVKFTAKRSPDQLRAAAEAAHHLLGAGQYERLHELRQALPQRGDLLEELDATSKRLHQARRYHDNRAVLEILVTLDPSNHKARRFLGELIERLDGEGDARALDQFEAAHRLDPSFPPYLANLGRNLLNSGKPEQFLAILEALLPHHREKVVDAHITALEAAALDALGRYEEASRLRRRWIDAGSRDPALFNDEARYLHAQGHSKAALELLDRAERAGAGDDYTISTRGSILSALGRSGTAGHA
jgi:3',5'-cyclic AMP phosphodiesterase CpdA